HQGRWQAMSPYYTMEPSPTGVPLDALDKITKKLTTAPEGFALHPKIARALENRARGMVERRPVDWGFAELLAFGSLLLEGTPVRLSGQDSRRGTFSQRHAVWYDYRSGQAYAPLAHLDPKQAKFAVYDSLLSESAVLGFEYGYSLDTPEALVAWE